MKTLKSFIILSSSPVPGNEKTVSTVLNLLMECGATVLYNDIADTHVSGHACEEELKLIQSLIRPKYFMPIHGEFRHLKRHAEIAQDLGLPEENIILAENGSVVEMTREKVMLSKDRIQAEAIMVDGLGVGDVGSAVINERRKLSESGVVVIAACYDELTGKIIDGPYIHTRGLVYVKEYGQILEEAKHELEDALDEAEKALADTQNELDETKDALAQAEDELDAAKNDIANMEDELAAAKDEIAQKEKEIEDLKTELEEKTCAAHRNYNCCEKCLGHHRDDFFGKIACFFMRVFNWLSDLFTIGC